MKRTILKCNTTKRANENTINKNSFGPCLKESKPLQVKCSHIKKLIHYDCNKKKDILEEDDIPDENEIYVKENLLPTTIEENQNNSNDDDFSIVNINMSKLLSLSNSNSKNTSYNANGSKENKNSREIKKKNNFSGGSLNKSKGGEVSSGAGSIESNNANLTNNNSNNTNSYSNSNNTSNNNNGKYSKDSVTAKRKKFYDKAMKKKSAKKQSNNELNMENDIKNNANKIYDSNDFDSMKNDQNNQSASSNIKITNNTNIILNVKSGTKSLDMRALNNNTNKDLILRDMRELHIITKKAICSISNVNPLLDTLDNYNESNRQRNFSNNKPFNKKPMKELLISDNTDYSINQLLINNLTINKKYNYLNNPNININFNNNKQSSSQIINIININGANYSMYQTKKQPGKSIQRTELSSIKESNYDNPYMTNVTKIQNNPKKIIKHQQYSSETYNKNKGLIKPNKTKVNKLNKLPYKKLSYSNWNGNSHGNTINTISYKGEVNNKNNKKYIEDFRNSNKTFSTFTNIKKGAVINSNKQKNK